MLSLHKRTGRYIFLQGGPSTNPGAEDMSVSPELLNPQQDPEVTQKLVEKTEQMALSMEHRFEQTGGEALTQKFHDIAYEALVDYFDVTEDGVVTQEEFEQMSQALSQEVLGALEEEAIYEAKTPEQRLLGTENDSEEIDVAESLSQSLDINQAPQIERLETLPIQRQFELARWKLDADIDMLQKGDLVDSWGSIDEARASLETVKKLLEDPVLQSQNQKYSTEGLEWREQRINSSESKRNFLEWAQGRLNQYDVNWESDNWVNESTDDGKDVIQLRTQNTIGDRHKVLCHLSDINPESESSKAPIIPRHPEDAQARGHLERAFAILIKNKGFLQDGTMKGLSYNGSSGKDHVDSGLPRSTERNDNGERLPYKPESITEAKYVLETWVQRLQPGDLIDDMGILVQARDLFSQYESQFPQLNNDNDYSQWEWQLRRAESKRQLCQSAAAKIHNICNAREAEVEWDDEFIWKENNQIHLNLDWSAWNATLFDASEDEMPTAFSFDETFDILFANQDYLQHGRVPRLEVIDRPREIVDTNPEKTWEAYQEGRARAETLAQNYTGVEDVQKTKEGQSMRGKFDTQFGYTPVLLVLLENFTDNSQDERNLSTRAVEATQENLGELKLAINGMDALIQGAESPEEKQRLQQVQTDMRTQYGSDIRTFAEIAANIGGDMSLESDHQARRDLTIARDERDEAGIKSAQAEIEAIRQRNLPRRAYNEEFEKYRNDDFRDKDAALEAARDAVLYAENYDEALLMAQQWLYRMNYSYSWTQDPREVQTAMAQTLQESLAQKLFEKEGRILDPENPRDAAEIRTRQIQLARLFTYRGEIEGVYDEEFGGRLPSINTPDHVQDSEFASRQCMEAMDFPALIEGYAKNQMDEEYPLMDAAEEKKAKLTSEASREKLRLLGAGDEADMEQFITKIDESFSVLETKDSSFDAMNEAYAILCFAEGLVHDHPRSAGEVVQEIERETQPYLNKAFGKFWNFLEDGNADGTLDTFGDSGATADEIVNVTGVDMTDEQREAFKLLSGIEGFDMMDLADDTHETLKQYGKIALYTAVAAALSVIPVYGSIGGAALVAYAIGAGASLAVTEKLIFQTGHDSVEEFLVDLGKDTTINAATYVLTVEGLRALGKVIRPELQASVTQAPRALSIGGRVVGPRAAAIAKAGGVATADHAMGSAVESASLALSEQGGFFENFGNIAGDPVVGTLVAIGGMSPQTIAALRRTDPHLAQRVDSSYQQLARARNQIASATGNQRASLAQIRKLAETQEEVAQALRQVEDAAQTLQHSLDEVAGQIDDMAGRIANVSDVAVEGGFNVVDNPEEPVDPADSPLELEEGRIITEEASSNHGLAMNIRSEVETRGDRRDQEVPETHNFSYEDSIDGLVLNTTEQDLEEFRRNAGKLDSREQLPPENSEGDAIA